MHIGVLLSALLLLMVIGYFLGRKRARDLARQRATERLHSITSYHGLLRGALVWLPALLICDRMVWPSPGSPIGP